FEYCNANSKSACIAPTLSAAASTAASSLARVSPSSTSSSSTATSSKSIALQCRVTSMPSRSRTCTPGASARTSTRATPSLDVASTSNRAHPSASATTGAVPDRVPPSSEQEDRVAPVQVAHVFPATSSATTASCAPAEVSASTTTLCPTNGPGW